MTKNSIYTLVAVLCLLNLTPNAYAFDHEIRAGIGGQIQSTNDLSSQAYIVSLQYDGHGEDFYVRIVNDTGFEPSPEKIDSDRVSTKRETEFEAGYNLWEGLRSHDRKLILDAVTYMHNSNNDQQYIENDSIVEVGLKATYQIGSNLLSVTPCYQYNRTEYDDERPREAHGVGRDALSNETTGSCYGVEYEYYFSPKASAKIGTKRYDGGTFKQNISYARMQSPIFMERVKDLEFVVEIYKVDRDTNITYLDFPDEVTSMKIRLQKKIY